MRVLLLLCFAACATKAIALSDWSSHGEVMVGLDRPAVEAEMVEALMANRSAMGWEAGVNEMFEGMTLGEAKALMGTLQIEDASEFLPAKKFDNDAMVEDLPTEFDWRTDPRASKCPSVSEIRDQSNCGSCWAFGSVEAMTDRICIASKGSSTVHLSAQDVTSCDVLGDMGCSGGVPSTVYSYYKTFGIVDGGNYGDKSMCWSYQLAPCAHHINGSKYPACPDSTKAPKCAHSCTDNGKSWAGSKHKGTGGYSVCGSSDDNSACSDKMAQEIYQNGPITGMFFVHQDFLTYKSGVYSPNILSPMLGGHAIKIMGYGNENGTPYWLVANSWNEGWGDKGYFKIKRGSNACQIENPIINGGPVAGMPAQE